jgi:uncharacterized membrane protein YbaN (DUF454 family)
MRIVYLVAGLLCVAIGGIGVFVPGLPTTVFFIMAAWCFSRSSERLERWVLNLPGIGPMVTDFRAGLGMPRRAKIIAISCIVLAVGLSAGLLIGNTVVRLVVLAVGLAGVWYVGIRVPTRETVLAAQNSAAVQAPQASPLDPPASTV